MSGHHRKVYFFHPVEIDHFGVEKFYPVEYFDQLHASITSHPNERLDVPFMGQAISGYARRCTSTLMNYLYIGRKRPVADWPKVREGRADATDLQLPNPDAALEEPAFLVQVRGTPYVAAIRSTSGATWSAIEHWLTSVAWSSAGGKKIELRPYVREDQLERLSRAIGASRIELTVEPGTRIPDKPGHIYKALRNAQEAGAYGISAKLILSFGNSTPTGDGSDQMADELRDVIANVPTRKAKATLMLPDDEEAKGWHKESVDFSKDIVTQQVKVGENENELQSVPMIMSSMIKAIEDFAKQNL
ncbi:hypothetical protein [Glutamicibacter arilaitensis]|uniref:hypothetical protein n=1 Tax=Glutamicibacter arilaitensis TaxID=256701 RepID=UPI003F8DDA9B